MKIKYFAWLKNITKKDSENITNKKIRDIKTLKQYLCSKYPDLEKYIIKENNIRIAVNLEYTLKLSRELLEMLFLKSFKILLNK